ncbi:hypothetical protein J3Q64DRAFT_1700257 [Phycomyces blakesleeanus]|uniref:Uncharacterized protein n=2 Tax=Phycomyces blakesleeanus TaxID=4837 RepID=A0A163EET6_PHYB8|nr:hypothetical protein PHYBLDRAFT_163385 [Phycomyces blakesleeanus NRRL 1555(-)]OAD78270.1 hypothetical protein PHYBLDRAFT_163385 [Phycomyces blakesleeanus NRRL 1555(-)]|eukprot:XP_018296310.1 hypothetical protein PHYBLDRAFT_163385 [Phycomyces blakesleeanus NRRL 1555(-)]
MYDLSFYNKSIKRHFKKKILMNLEARSDENDNGFKETPVRASANVPSTNKCLQMIHFNAFKNENIKKKRKQSYLVKAQKSKAKRWVTSSSSSYTNGHSTASSKACPNHVLSKQKVVEANLGSNYQAFNRKSALDTMINNACRNTLRNRIIDSSIYIQQIGIKAMLFTNYFILENLEPIPDCIFKQNYCRRTLKYCYQFVCGVSPKWENCHSLSEDLKEQIKDICLPLKGLLPMEATLVTLSEQTRLPLPRLYDLYPNPSMHVRSIAISINGIRILLSLSLPRAYNDQLKLISPFHSLQLKLSYFNYQEVEQEYMPVFIDPDRAEKERELNKIKSSIPTPEITSEFL